MKKSKDRILLMLGRLAIGIMFIACFVAVCYAYSCGIKFAEEITETKDIELMIIDKEEHKDVVTTGKTFFVRRYYSITVELENGTPYEIKCSKSEYTAVEVGKTAIFTVSFSNRNGYIFSVKLKGGY